LRSSGALGKLKVDGDLIEAVSSRGIAFLGINEHHAARVEHLGPHHNDPFDRMLIAQAQVENLAIIAVDSHFARYDVALA
jgi:PIN domain nuclease of toxin-antitoxin system